MTEVTRRGLFGFLGAAAAALIAKAEVVPTRPDFGPPTAISDEDQGVTCQTMPVHLYIGAEEGVIGGIWHPPLQSDPAEMDTGDAPWPDDDDDDDGFDERGWFR